MAILKLATGRENAVSGTVSRVERDNSGQFGPQYKIELDGNDLLYLDEKAVDRQVQRAETTAEALVGQTVTFWKKPIDGSLTKGYLNLEIGQAWGAKPGVAGAVAAAARNDDYVGRDLRARDVPVKPAITLDELKDKYAQCLGHAHALVEDYKESLGGEAGPDAVYSVADTLFIQRIREGV